MIFKSKKINCNNKIFVIYKKYFVFDLYIKLYKYILLNKNIYLLFIIY